MLLPYMHISIFEYLFFEKIARQMLVIFSSSSLSHVDAITWPVVLLLMDFWLSKQTTMRDYTFDIMKINWYRLLQLAWGCKALLL